MSQQQEFYNEPQEERQRQATWQARSTRPTRRGRQTHTGDVPKSEHPSTFEEIIPPHSYRAQDQATYREQEQVQGYRGYQEPFREQTRARTTRQAPQNQTSSEWWRSGQSGQGARQRQGQFYWNMQRRRSGIPTWIIIVALLVFFTPLIPILLSIVGIILTGIVFIVLLPLLIIFALLVVAVVIGIMMFFGLLPRRTTHWWRW